MQLTRCLIVQRSQDLGMAKVRKVLIVGGGIGGLSAAIALRNANIEVDVAEINQTWKIYQTGIVIQANAVRALAALGVANEAIESGFPYKGVIFQDIHDKVLQRLTAEKLAGEDYPSRLGITRPALHDVLSKGATDRNANIRLGLTFRNMVQSADKVTVSFTDGSTSDYDVVIGADGVYSKVRSFLFGDDFKPKFTGQGTWRCNVPRPKEVDYSFIAMGLKSGKCGFIPLSQETGYVWIVQEEPGNPFYQPEQMPEIFRERLAECTGILGRLRDSITASSPIVYRPLEALLMPKPWYKGRILLIGDSAHATTPHMGQGSAQAVEDAVVLGELLVKNKPIAELFEEFMQRRYERCKFIVESSLQIGEWEMRPTPDADPAGLTQKMLEVTSEPI